MSIIKVPWAKARANLWVRLDSYYYQRQCLKVIVEILVETKPCIGILLIKSEVMVKLY
jgi:hypothetical protein